MNLVSIGDMAQAYQLRNHSTQMKARMNQLTNEMASGVKSDIGAAVKGDFSTLAGIDRSLTTLEAYAASNAEATQFASGLQTSLQSIQSMTTAAGPGLLSSSSSTAGSMINSAALDARQKFDSVIGVLNSSSAGRYAFSGVASDTIPLATPDEIMTALQTAISGQTSATGIADAVADWFAAPAGGGGYLDVAYKGGAAASPLRLADGETASISVTATDPAIMDTLQGFALGALVDAGALSTDAAGQGYLLQKAGEKVMAADVRLVDVQTRVGQAESQIDSATTRNANEKTALTIARNNLVQADPFETATALTAAQAQMEALYTLTARLAQMSFTDYMR
jgi:flagellar hook-associated protein 3 FlgL